MTKTLSLKYNQLYQNSYPQILSGAYEIDRRINDPSDQRFGITLLIRPTPIIKSSINELLKQFQAIEPNQYYYPETDIHITVMSIISCYHGFQLDSIDVSQYVSIIMECLDGLGSFNISYDGLTVSPSCVMLQGFPLDDSLETVRNQLREAFKRSDLEHSIDKRYTIQTAHSTVIRFQEELTNYSQMALLIKQLKEVVIGTFTVESLELVFNDWYQKESKVQKLHEFSLTQKDVIT